MSETFPQIFSHTKKKCPVALADVDVDEDYDMEIDVLESIVQSIDGVIIDGDDDEVKLQFFYLIPGGIDVEEERIRCKCVAEFRVSRKNFMPIAREMNQRAKSFKTKQKTLFAYSTDQEVPLYT